MITLKKNGVFKRVKDASVKERKIVDTMITENQEI